MSGGSAPAGATNPNTLSHVLERAADRRPDHPAVVDPAETLTWSELDTLANRIAGVLVGLGVQRGDRVALRATKSARSLAAAYGIMRCGAAYVPLDLREPIDRSREALDDAQIRVLIGEPNRRGSWEGLDEGSVAHLLNLGKQTKVASSTATVIEWPELLGADGARRPSVPSRDDLAYVLYTSGSTGKRKGVMLSHTNSLAFAQWAADAVELTEHDRLSSHAPMHFDLSVFDFYSAALAAATTYIVPSTASIFPGQLASFLADNELTIWYSVPTTLRMLTDKGGLEAGDLPMLRTIVFAGEVYPVDQLRELMALFPGRTFWNWFGPTETNVCLAHRLNGPPADGLKSVPVGQPSSGAEIVIVDDAGVPVADGEPGELLVAGPTVLQGYWGDEERSQRCMVPHPLDPSKQAFRTGDLVQAGPDGELLFIGRNDHQVKTRGYRVELGDIESFLVALDGIDEAAVVPVADPLVTNQLHAFLSGGESASGSDEHRAAIRKACRSGLPDYMMPRSLTWLDALPRTLNDKIDRQGLLRLAEADAGSAT